MYEPFPKNYIWNLSINLILACGGSHGEVDVACKPIRDAAARGEDAGTAAFFDSWMSVADKLVALAQEDEQRGRLLSAGTKYKRASIYYGAAERMQHRDYGPRKVAYAKSLELFLKGVKLANENCERVEIAYEGSSYPGFFVKAEGKNGKPAPCVVFVNGLDSSKEMIYGAGFAQEFARRGVSTLMVDQPGTGEAIRLKNLHVVYNAERWASKAVDYLMTRKDVDHDRIGIVGISMGGYHAPRAAAFEKRFKLCAVIGANHNWGEMQKRRLNREGDNPVPHYWDHVKWVFGITDMDALIAYTSQLNLNGVVDKITVPFLVTHGGSDRQIPVEYAHQSYDQAVNSPKRELRIFTDENGWGVEHCNADNPYVGRDYVADWIAETFGTWTA